MDCSAIDYWRKLCLNSGELIHFDSGEYFSREGEVARYFGFIQSGTLKYSTIGEDGTEHVLGMEFAGGFVSDFPFSISGLKARTSIIAASPCDILCISTKYIRDHISTNPDLLEVMFKSTEAVFGTVYDRYKDLYTKPAQRRYEEMISKHPDLFQFFTLRDIASFLKITPTHLSRLRKNIK